MQVTCLALLVCEPALAAAKPACGPVDAPADPIAYRTRPAPDAELKAGTKIIVCDATKPSSESDAHAWRAWTFETVVSIDRFTKEILLEGGSKRPIANARVMLVYWLRGEDAAAVD